MRNAYILGLKIRLEYCNIYCLTYSVYSTFITVVIRSGKYFSYVFNSVSSGQQELRPQLRKKGLKYKNLSVQCNAVEPCIRVSAEGVGGTNKNQCQYLHSPYNRQSPHLQG